MKSSLEKEVSFQLETGKRAQVKVEANRKKAKQSDFRRSVHPTLLYVMTICTYNTRGENVMRVVLT